MKFFSDKNIISTIFAITLFNGVFTQGAYNPMVHYPYLVPGAGSSPNGNKNQLHSTLFSDDSEPETPSSNDFPDNFGIHQGAPNQENAEDGPLIDNNNRAPQFDINGITTTSTPTSPVSPVTSPVTSPTTSPASRAVRPKTTSTTSNQLTTTTTTTTNVQSTQTTQTTPTPTPTPPPATNNNSAPAPKSGNQIVDTIFGVIKSIFGFFWSHRVGIWNFLYENILTPIWNWVKNKWFS
jgi:hypothetical protein